jgi:O-antigen ligase
MRYAERPLGIGFDGVAFGRALKVKYGETGPGHSHSGLIDLAVGTGLPGVLMWCALLAYLMAASIRRFIKHTSCFALMALFTVFNFSIRMVVDSKIRDRMLQQFISLTAFFFTAMLKEDRSAIAGAG